MINPIKYPMRIIVDVIASSLTQLRISSEMDKSKKMPHIKAKRDKNNSQRMSDFRVK
jgi:hypothetical protein